MHFLLVIFIGFESLLHELVTVPQLTHLIKQGSDLARVVLGLADLFQGLALLVLDALQGGVLRDEVCVLLFRQLQLGLQFVDLFKSYCLSLRMQFLSLFLIYLDAHLLESSVQIR